MYRNIAIKENTYQELKLLKKHGRESFDEVIQRVLESDRKERQIAVLHIAGNPAEGLILDKD